MLGFNHPRDNSIIILNIVFNFFSCHWSFRSIFRIFSRRSSELLSQYAQSSRQLSSVRPMVTQEECRLPVVDYELGNIHDGHDDVA